MDHDAALARTAPALDRHQAAAVSDGGKHQGVERCAVDQPRCAGRKLAADPGPDVITGSDDHISTEAPCHRLIGRSSNRQHPQAVCFRQLDCVTPDRPRAADNCDRGPPREGECVQREPCRGRIEQQRGRLREADPARSMHNRCLSGHDLLGISAPVRAHRNDECDDRVADREPAVGATSELVDNARNIHPGYVGREPIRQLGGSSAGPERYVGGVHRYRVNSYPDLTGTRLRLGEVDDLEDPGAAELDEPDCLHRRTAFHVAVVSRRRARVAGTNPPAATGLSCRSLSSRPQ